jgi:3-dehydroquinate synthase
MISLVVDLGDRSYPIFIGSGLMSGSSLAEYLVGSQTLVVTNETIAPLYLDRLLSALPEGAEKLIIEDGEQFKTLDTFEKIVTRLLESGFSRNCNLVALGGGVVGDVTGFVAASYQRGVNFIQVPTTLLAQVDSSVGGKTAVNHPLGKNMIGAFYQPSCVLIDTDTLETLPEREFAAGLAEVIKYGLIRDRQFFDWLGENLDSVLCRDKEALAYIIENSCNNKAEVVSEDETEAGVRALLNLGHTFGHAIEAFQNYRQLLHGEAVAIGMVMASRLSCLQGNLDQTDVSTIIDLLGRAGLPTCCPADMQAEDFMDKMKVDKKNRDGKLRLVLMHSVGDAYVADDVPVDQIKSAINSSR